MKNPLFANHRSWPWVAAILACACTALPAAPLPDISTVPADLSVPELVDGPPAKGKRVRLELFKDTPPVILYLPTDWAPDKKFPVIIELAGNGNFKNSFGDTSSGLPEGSKLGYGLSGGKGFVWACVPFLNEAGNKTAITWWGDAPAYRPDSTVAFLKRAVPALCERFSGDPQRVILCGFSRGAIATNAIGLHDDEIAALWRGFVCYSHYDGLSSHWPFAGKDADSVRQRLARLKGRPQLICSESPLAGVRKHLESAGAKGEFTFLDTGFRNHNDAWTLRPSIARDAARAWLADVVKEPAAPASDLTSFWTFPDAYFLHGNPSPGWPEVQPQARPGSYWWWPGSAVTREDLTWNLETYHKAGWGNMGAIGIYGVKGEEERSIPLFSPEWFDRFNHAVTEARRLGMNIDLTPSGGWRLGGPHVTKEHSERSFAVKDGKIEVGVRNVRVKRTGPGGEGLCINPYSPAAVKFHFDWLADRFREGKGLSPRAFYYDSFENQGNWAPELPDRFQKWRGYDIHAHAAALGGTGDPEEVRRVLCDYRETLSDLLLECVGQIARWGDERGSGLRMQAHGAPANLLDMYAAASIPETEVFGANKFDIPGFRRDPRWSLDQPHSEMVNRFASSAAHVGGRNLVISESFTWLRNHFHTALSHIKPEADRLLLCGINGIYYHGTCYSPEKTEWPGWLFYASTQVNARNSIFRDIPALNAYLTRCQSVLQQGKPHNDILLYWPVYDLWMSGGKGEKRFSVHDSSWIEKQPCGDAGRWLMQQGHTFDFVSDAQLAKTRWQGGSFITEGGATYQTILVPAAKAMKIETARRLIELANAGASIVIWKNLPETIPGWYHYIEREKELRSLLGDLKFVDGIATVGKGRILLGDDLAALVAKTGINREAMADHGLKFIRRKLPVEVVYFIANQSAKPVDEWVPLAAPCRSALLMDPMTGALGKAHTRIENALTAVHLQLQPGESRILRVLENKDVTEPSWPILKPAGEALAVNGPWNIRVLEGGPVLPAPATVKTPASWTETNDPEARRFAGTASYSTSFTLTGKATDHWLLDLGDVRESARVRINGKPAGMVIAHPFRLDVTDFLRDGANSIEIEVTNLSANRIRDLDLRKVGWKKFHEINFVDHQYKRFDASEWPIEPSGLLGPVTLLPMMRFGDIATKNQKNNVSPELHPINP